MERIFNNVKITSSFEIPETRENLVSGETIGQHFGKIAKVIDDLENGEFSCNLTIDDTLSDTSENPVQNKIITSALNNKAESNHVHSYAGSSSEGGSATSAVKLDSSAGSSVNPVYFSEGKPVACTYTLGKSVPSDAVFTDTIYTLPKATISALGGVMPDGTTITVDENGVISLVGGGGSSGGMKLIGSYATTYSGTSTSSSVLSDEIELPIDLYENNRILLIRTDVNTNSSTSYQLNQNYSMIKIEIPYDNSKYRVIRSSLFRVGNWMRFELYYRPETNKLSCALELDLNYLGRTSFDIYDMGVIE